MGLSGCSPQQGCARSRWKGRYRAYPSTVWRVPRTLMSPVCAFLAVLLLPFLGGRRLGTVATLGDIMRNSGHDDARGAGRARWTATCVTHAGTATVSLTAPSGSFAAASRSGGWRRDGHGRRRSRPPAHGAACHAAWDPAAALIPPVALVVRPEPAGERQSYSGLDVDSRTGRRRRRSQSLGFSGVTTHHTRRRDVKCPLKTAMTRPS